MPTIGFNTPQQITAVNTWGPRINGQNPTSSFAVTEHASNGTQLASYGASLTVQGDKKTDIGTAATQIQSILLKQCFSPTSSSSAQTWLCGDGSSDSQPSCIGITSVPAFNNATASLKKGKLMVALGVQAGFETQLGAACLSEALNSATSTEAAALKNASGVNKNMKRPSMIVLLAVVTAAAMIGSNV